VLLRPREIFARRSLSVIARRAPLDWEAARLGAGMIVVECSTGAEAGPVELAMSEGALTGFLAWLEAAPRANP
jgi:hypothetical protein